MQNLGGWAVAALCRAMSLDNIITFLTAALLERQVSTAGCFSRLAGCAGAWHGLLLGGQCEMSGQAQRRHVSCHRNGYIACMPDSPCPASYHPSPSCQIVVFCPNAGLLSGVVLSLIPLLLPFHWQCLLLPVLPAAEGRLELMEVRALVRTVLCVLCAAWQQSLSRSPASLSSTTLV